MRASLRFRLFIGVLIGGFTVALTGAAVPVFAAATPYPAAVSTTVTIKVVRTALLDECVQVQVGVHSDAGTPTGTIDLSIDGTFFASHALPKNGSSVFSISCSGTRGASFREVPATRASVLNAAYVVRAQPAAASEQSALSVGDHVLTATYVPTGNWKGGSASAKITIIAPTSVTVPHGFDAGLASFGSAASGLALWVRELVSGLAILAAAGAVWVYRRRQSQPAVEA